MKKILLFFLLVAPAERCIYAQTILGTDVSHYEGAITWSQVKNPGGKTFSWAKATEGINYTDPTFVTNATQGTTAGVIMGGYHFAHPETNTAAAEASYFVSKAGPYIGAGYLPPALDLEDPSGGTPLTTYYAGNAAALTTWVVDWCTAVKNATGVAPVIYTDGSIAGFLQSGVTAYGLWMADPDGNSGTPPATTGVWSTWMFKQYSWTGTVSGMPNASAVDLDVFNGTSTAFNTLVNSASGSVTAAFTSSLSSVCEGNTVTYTDHSTSTGTITGYNWTFPGGSPPNSTSQNQVVTYSTSGTYNVKEVVTSSVGADSITKQQCVHVIPSSTLPLVETFQSTTFPPAGWTMNYPVLSDSAWELCYNNGYNSSQCMYFPANCGYVTSTAGQRQQIYTPDYSFVGTTSPALWFDVAYEPYNTTYSDTLAIYYSLDCGNTWTRIYLKGGMTLCTTGSTDMAGTDTSGGNGCFIPPNSQAWRVDSVYLSSLVGQPSVMFSFESQSGWGNIIYIDNINISSTVPVSCTPPANPTIVSPGTSTGPGTSLTSVTLQWNTTTGATGYYPHISECPYGNSNTVWNSNCVTGTSVTASGLATGNIYRWATTASSDCSNSNCTSGSSNVLYFNIPPVLAANGITSFCPGDSVQLTTTAGNTNSTPKFLWYLNGQIIDSTSTGSYYAKASGGYTAAIEYACGLTGVSNAVSVTVYTPPSTPLITANPSTTNCGPIQLTATSTGCPCNYHWSTGGNPSQSITANSSGTYTVTATANNCPSQSASITVTVNQPPTVTASANTNSSCTGQQITLTATGNATSYQWSGANLQTNSGSSVNASPSVTGAQTYTVTATLNSCTATANAIVNVSSTVAPTITINQTTTGTVCIGSSVNFNSSITNGGNNPVYSWSVSNGQTGTGSSFTLTNATNGVTVICKLVSNSSCAIPDSAVSNTLTISATQAQQASINIFTADTNVCSGENINFTATTTGSGNNPTYAWFVNSSLQGTGSSFSINNVQGNAAVYCQMTSSLSCATGSPAQSGTLNIHIQNQATASISIFSFDSVVCNDASATLTAIAGNGGNAPVYGWQINGNPAGPNSSSFNISNIQSTDTVICVLTSSATCVVDPTVSSNSIIIGVDPVLTANAGTTANVYPTQISSAIIGGTPAATGGTAPYNYLWIPSNGLNASNLSNPTVSGLTSNTTYTLNVTDAIGCSATDTITVNVLSCNVAVPTLQLHLCDLAAQYMPSVSYQWYWYNNSIAEDTTRFLSANNSGYYYVVITDSNGCKNQSADTYVSYPGCLSTGINEVSGIAAFEIYPNPANEQVTVSLYTQGLNMLIFRVMDMTGKVVYTSAENSSGKITRIIDVSSLSAGVYIVEISSGENSARNKFVIAR